MKNVVHFSFSSNGGAGKAARRAAKACAAVGIAAVFAFIDGEAQDEIDIKIKHSSPHDTYTNEIIRFVRDLQWSDIVRLKTQDAGTLLSVPFPSLDLFSHPLFQAADIIHLHWISWSLSPVSLNRFEADGKLIIWTFHDMWPFTGGCHYAGSCRQYETECMKCPQINDDLSLIPNCFAEKINAYMALKNLVVVTPSEWLARRAGASSAFRKFPIAIVNNGLETDIFAPSTSRDELRRSLGLEEHDIVYLFASFDNSEKRKGAHLLRESLRILDQFLHASTDAACSRVVALFIGKPSERLDAEFIEEIHLGEINDDLELAKIYNIADFVLIPSLEDNYPNIILEAASCGTPAVAYASGGIPEMIDDANTGFLVSRVGDVADYAAVLIKTLSLSRDGKRQLRVACRSKIENANSLKSFGESLFEVYNLSELDHSDLINNPSYNKVFRGSRNLLKHVSVPINIETDGSFFRFPMNLNFTKRTNVRFNDVAGHRSTILTKDADRAAKTHVVTTRIHHAHHSARSGPYQFLRFLSEEFKTENFAIPLGSNLAGEMNDYAQKIGRAIGMAGYGSQFNSWLCEAEIMRKFQINQFDCIHHIDGDISGFWSARHFARNVPREVRPKIICTLHQPPSILHNMVSWSWLQNYDVIVALCEAQASYIRFMVPGVQVYVIPHGIDTEFYVPSSNSKPKLHMRELRLLAVGHWLRDYPASLMAMDILRERGINAHLTVICHNFPFDISKHSNVSLLSGLSDEALLQSYQDADCLFLPLSDATANNAILEAMACGLPIVSTDVGGVYEAVGKDCAVLCAKGDSVGLANAICQLATQEDKLVAMGIAGRSRAVQLSWKSIGQMHEQLYRSL